MTAWTRLLKWRGVPLTERILGWVTVSGLFVLLMPNWWWVSAGPVAFEFWVTVDNLARLGTVWSRDEDLRHRTGHRITGLALACLAVIGAVVLGFTGHVEEISLVVVPAAVIAWTDWLRSALAVAPDRGGAGDGGPGGDEAGDREPREPGPHRPAGAMALPVPEAPSSIELRSDGGQSRP